MTRWSCARWTRSTFSTHSIPTTRQFPDDEIDAVRCGQLNALVIDWQMNLVVKLQPSFRQLGVEASVAGAFQDFRAKSAVHAKGCADHDVTRLGLMKRVFLPLCLLCPLC